MQSLVGRRIEYRSGKVQKGNGALLSCGDQ